MNYLIDSRWTVRTVQRLKLAALLCLLTWPMLAQSDITGIELEGATALHLSTNFSRVDLRIHEGDQVVIEHTVTIDGVAHPELCKLDISRRDSILRVEETGPTMKELTRVQDRVQDRGWDGNTNTQVRMVIRVPKWLAVSLKAVYGEVVATDVPYLREVNATYGAVTVVYRDTSVPGSLRLYSNYGAVDLTLPTDTGAALALTTQFGELLTDFDITLDAAGSEQRQFYEHVEGTIGGGGAQLSLESPYGKVYLRKG